MINSNKIRLISLIIPCFNEELSVDRFIKTVIPIIDSIDAVVWELIFIDDGSIDRTLSILINYAKQDSRIRVVGFSRNFGKETALTAGIDYSTGDAVIPIDVDLQDPPLLLCTLVEKYLEGWAIVQPVRKTRAADSWFKRTSARLFYFVMSKLTTIDISPNVGDFQLLSREVVDAIKQYPERTRFMKGIIASVGFSRTKIYFDRPSRMDGASKFGTWKLWNFAIEGIASFSTLPLRVWSYIGFMVAIASFVWSVWLIIRTMYFGVVTPGYASIFASVLFLGGLQLMGIGIIGEYVGRISIETRNRPLYHVSYESEPATVKN